MRIFLLQISLLLLFPLGVMAQCDLTISKPTLAGEQFIDNQIFAGSKYFMDEWAIGTVTLQSGDIVQNQLLRYNALEDELIWLEQNSSSTVRVDKSLVLGFSLQLPQSDSALVFTKGTFFKNQTSSFLQVLRKGKVTLYAKRWVEKTSNVEIIHIGGNAKRAIAIFPRTNYFVETQDGNFRSVALNRRSFVNAFAADSTHLSRKLLRQNRIRIKNEHDLVAAIGWLETNLEP
ncbi:hypothetical protein [Perlabentimonas gracilis]|uniref:hypothetical protein n=1 Tax=Perlabentimonas gracilis TaxID=2715279 RepID=UPI001409845E|nr:hypothetical protein [Perlabentimonas gracilis]NHB67220.1 hypothetical protein [Perlabentimonas gracilis]